MPKTSRENESGVAASNSNKQVKSNTTITIPKKSPSKKSPSKKSKTHSSSSHHHHHHHHHQYTVADSLPVILPASLAATAAAAAVSSGSSSSNECQILVQIDPDDAERLDFEGSTGAIGRFQVDSNGIVLDLKGSQYRGSLVAGPTVTMASLCYAANSHEQQLRVEVIVDEFCAVSKTHDALTLLEGTGTGIDDSYAVQEEDVNILHKQMEQEVQKNKKKQRNKAESGAATTATTITTPGGASSKKRTTTKKNSTVGTTSSNKKQRVSIGRKK